MHSETCRVSYPARPAVPALMVIVALVAGAGLLVSGLALPAHAAQGSSAGAQVAPPVAPPGGMSSKMRQMLSQSSSGLVIVPRKSGMLSMSLGGRFMSAMKAHLDEHGNVVLSCEGSAAVPPPAKPANTAIQAAPPAPTVAGSTISGPKE